MPNMVTFCSEIPGEMTSVSTINSTSFKKNFGKKSHNVLKCFTGLEIIIFDLKNSN